MTIDFFPLGINLNTCYRQKMKETKWSKNWTCCERRGAGGGVSKYWTLSSLNLYMGVYRQNRDFMFRLFFNLILYSFTVKDPV